MLFIVLENNRYSADYSREIFDEYADRDEGKEIEYISLDKLSSLSVKHSIFSPESQNRLIGNPSEDYNIEYAWILENYQRILKKITERLKAVKAWNRIWKQRLKEYEKRIKSNKRSKRSKNIMKHINRHMDNI